MKNNIENVKVVSTRKKISVEYVATVNKVSYFVDVRNPERVYTEHEIIRTKR